MPEKSHDVALLLTLRVLPFFQEKLNYFWIVQKKKIEDLKAALRNKEREEQDIEEKHQVEIKVRLLFTPPRAAIQCSSTPQVYKQRIKHLLFEHQNETTVKKTDVQVSMKIAQGDHRTSEGELKKDRRALKQELKEMQIAHDDHMRGLKMVRVGWHWRLFHARCEPVCVCVNRSTTRPSRC